MQHGSLWPKSLLAGLSSLWRLATMQCWHVKASPIPGQGGVAYTVVPEREALQFHNIVDLNDWIVVPHCLWSRSW